jgi:Mg-chelatase subunit ChlD
MSVFAQDPELDLPVIDPKERPAMVPAPSPPPPEGDPRDEPGPVFFGEEIESENNTIIYVIDCSGSMGRDRLTKAKTELKRSIEGLPANFSFNIISYHCYMIRFWPNLQRATDSNKEIAKKGVDGLGASGGTATGPATAMALDDKQVMSVVLLTDGGPNCGAQNKEGHRRMINNANSQRATISVFGISASGDYRAFCQQVASDSGGAYIDLP